MLFAGSPTICGKPLAVSGFCILFGATMANSRKHLAFGSNQRYFPRVSMRLIGLLFFSFLSALTLPSARAQGAPPVPSTFGVPVIVTNSNTAFPGQRTILPPQSTSRIPFPRPPEQRTQQAFPAPNAATRIPNAIPARTEPTQPEPLKWDAVIKEYTAKPGEETAHMSFSFTNASSTEVVINWVRTSCGCTLAKLPPTPWTNAPGATGEINITMDLRGKVGTLSKMVTVDTSHGPKFLTVKANIPTAVAGMDSRTRNMELAKVDRQIVFKNDCATCHSEPAKGKHGEALFAAACAICHDSPHRATMVPDLRALKVTPTPEYWKAWIVNGKPGSLMPAFAKEQNGILDEEQINSLVEYLSKNYPPKQTSPAAGSAQARPAATGAIQ
jgi:mono/diheme cytochrome c family protein